MLVYILNNKGKPLMPCKPQKARKLLKHNKAKVIKKEPFTIQLLFGSSGYKQLITLGKVRVCQGHSSTKLKTSWFPAKFL